MQNDRHRGELASKMGGLGAAPSDDLWGKIESNLDEKKKRKGFVWWWVGGGLAATFGLMLFATKIYSDKNELGLIGKQNNTKEILKLKQSGLPLNENGLGNDLLSVEVDVVDESIEMLNRRKESLNDTKKSSVVNVSIFDSVKKNEAPIGIASNDVDLLPLIDMSKIEVTYDPSMANEFAIDVVPPPVKARKWEIGLDVDYFGSILNEKVYPSQVLNDVGDGFEVVSPVVGNQLFVEERSGLIGGGVSIGYRIKPKVLICSGLQLSQFNYVEKQYFSTGNNYYEKKNKEGVITLPVSIQFDFPSQKRINFNGGVGFISQFPFRFKSSINYGMSNLELIAPLSEEKKNTFASSYYGAVELKLGMAYNFTDRFRLQATPAFRYYAIRKAKDGGLLIDLSKYWIGGKIGLIWKL